MTTPLPRTAFPVTRRWTYLDHAGIGPLPAPAVEAMTGYTRDLAAGGRTAVPGHLSRLAGARRSAARLLGVAPDEVAVVKNTTEGLAFVAAGLPWEEGDRVVVPDGEFPSALYPWLALRDRGVVVDRVRPVGAAGRLPVELLAEHVRQGPPPRLVALSWVQYATGWRTDLKALAECCRQVGALLCVDAVQGLGAIPAAFGEWGVDFAAAGGHKWLLGPQGVGLLYVRRSRLPLLRPAEPGWNAVAHRGDYADLRLVFDDSARRLEGGSLNRTGLIGLGASADLLLDAGIGAVWSHITALGDRACAGLEEVGAEVTSDRSPAGRSGIVRFRVPGADPEGLARALRERGIVCVARGDGLRISPHGYTSEEEVDALVGTVAEHRR